MDFLFHNLSEKEKEEIKKQVDSILSSFSKKLSEIEKGSKESEGNFIEREECERTEGGKPAELSKEIMFENAPDKNSDFIIAERKKW
jgi:Asp-tRNA(Asn)/Glu-tRNA(Gln) amidotransferase C subunit